MSEEKDVEMVSKETLEFKCILDTAALLGGNEYLIQQMLDKLCLIDYKEQESKAIDWIRKKLRCQDAKVENQKDLTDLFSSYQRERLPSNTFINT